MPQPALPIEWPVWKPFFTPINSALSETTKETEQPKRSMLNQIIFENYGYCIGFNKL